MKSICENLSLTEVVGDSSYADPIRVKVKVNTGDARFKKDYDLQQAVVRAISRSILSPEILVDESDGTYQLCFPGRADWLKTVQDTVQYNITSKARLEIQESLCDTTTVEEDYISDMSKEADRVQKYLHDNGFTSAVVRIGNRSELEVTGYYEGQKMYSVVQKLADIGYQCDTLDYEMSDYGLVAEINKTKKMFTESISEQQIASVLADARDQADEFGVTEEFTFEYYIGNAVSAAGYPSSKLFMFLNDHVSETDKEYRDALRGWKENEGIDSSAEDNFIPDDDM